MLALVPVSFTSFRDTMVLYASLSLKKVSDRGNSVVIMYRVQFFFRLYPLQAFVLLAATGSIMYSILQVGNQYILSFDMLCCFMFFTVNKSKKAQLSSTTDNIQTDTYTQVADSLQLLSRSSLVIPSYCSQIQHARVETLLFSRCQSLLLLWSPFQTKSEHEHTLGSLIRWNYSFSVAHKRE